MIRPLALCLIAAAIAPDCAVASPRGRNGQLVESGTENGYRFRTYMRETRRTGDLRIGFVRIFHQPEQVRRLEWRYIAQCQAGAARPTGVTIERTKTTEDTEAFVTVIPGTNPSNADRIWHNVWYAACHGEFNKYPPRQD